MRQLERAIRVLESCGARAEIEQRIVELTERARSALGPDAKRAGLTPPAREILDSAISALTARRA
jgi:hypothetical protein